jgi:hypothetical protein
LLPPEHPHKQERVGAEADRIADALCPETPGLATIAVAQRIHRDVRLAGIGPYQPGMATR